MKNKLSIIALIITLLGAFGIGINIILSELIYSEIEDFTNTPLPYQMLMYISLFISIVGIILSIKYRNKTNTKKQEMIIELVLIIIGMLLMIILGLAKNESFINNLFICIGGGLFIIGILSMISTQIGLNKKPKPLTITEILKKTDVNDLVVSIFLYIAEKSKYGKAINSLLDEEKTIYTVLVFVEEVYNGGFEQFLDNSSKDLLDDLLDSFNKIKAYKLIDIYQELIEKFPLDIPKDQREEIYDEIIEKNTKIIRECDLKLYQLEEKYIDKIIYDYVMDNIDNFK